MNPDLLLELYQGNGTTLQDRDVRLPPQEPSTGMEHPGTYIAEPGLRDAVNVALTLGQPLLVTGEPGTGKTRLAYSLAWELGLNEPLVFHTKTTSTASDLFYQYDALRRFQDIHLGERNPIETYITCQALGTAILLANPKEKEHAGKILPEYLKNKDPLRSVVLIDEIDKAPRDLPNDVLNEVEKMTFSIKESPEWPPFTADHQYRPILVLTSNSEKNLPEAFLRRCVFYHINFPGADALSRIVFRRFKDRPGFNDGFIHSAIVVFEKIRGLDLKKKPATAEFLGWISILRALGVDLSDMKDQYKQALQMSCSVLAKTQEDLEIIKAQLPKLVWQA